MAKGLLGKYLIHRTPDGTTAGMITETEAYTGLDDPASHSYRKNSKRTAVQYKDSGLAYIFMIYGMYYCFNITTGPKGSPEVVLFRALKPVLGIELMQSRRKNAVINTLANGPGKLTMAMSIDMSHYGQDLTSSDLFISAPLYRQRYNIKTTKRVNIDYSGYAKDFPYRFVIDFKNPE